MTVAPLGKPWTKDYRGNASAGVVLLSVARQARRVEHSSIETAHVDAQSEEWFASYVEPANQRSDRHRRVRHRHRGDPRRQRLYRLQTMMMVGSVVFVGAMTACFYVVLTR